MLLAGTDGKMSSVPISASYVKKQMNAYTATKQEMDAESYKSIELDALKNDKQHVIVQCALQRLPQQRPIYHCFGTGMMKPTSSARELLWLLLQ